MWEILTTEVFDEWFFAQSEDMREDVLAMMGILAEMGPQLGRPYVDTLKGCKLTHLKELRIQHHGNPVRAFFAFDPVRRAIVLCAGDKTGVNQKQFYRSMIRMAEAEYRRHLMQMEG